jgi:hypothetical protein
MNEARIGDRRCEYESETKLPDDRYSNIACLNMAAVYIDKKSYCYRCAYRHVEQQLADKDKEIAELRERKNTLIQEASSKDLVIERLLKTIHEIDRLQKAIQEVEMTDVELAALTELVAADRFCMEADNHERMKQGYALAYDGSVQWDNRDALEAELQRRGIIK